MRWTRPQIGQERTRTYFAWLPVTVDRETRWLTTVTVVERYFEGLTGSVSKPYFVKTWYPKEFKD